MAMKKTARKSISLLLVLAMLYGLVVGMITAAYALDDTGYTPISRMEDLLESGEEALPGAYSIADDDDLLAFAEYVNSGKRTSGVTFYLRSNISLDRKTWLPVGTVDAPFCGTFDGCGYSISDVGVKYGESNAAFFAYLNGTVKNLGISGTAFGIDTAAGIAAMAVGASIENCWSAVRATGNTSGGIAAIALGSKITNCCDFASVEGTETEGAIVAALSGGSELDYCYYPYYKVDNAVGSKDEKSTARVYRFATSPSMCVCETEVTIGSGTSEDLTELLNFWVDTQEASSMYRSWVFDASTHNQTLTGGRYPVLRYPNYASQETEVYSPTATMTQLYEQDADVENGGFYSISCGEELGYLAEYVNKGRETKGATFYLTTDITVISKDAHYKGLYNGESWIPIGATAAYSFRGTFDGQGFVLTELIQGDENKNAGLFGFINDSTAMVKNLGVFAVTAGGNYVGGIAAQLTQGTIENCWVAGSLIGKKACGGIVGVVDYGSVINCACFGAATTTDDDITAGGVVGDLNVNGLCQYCYYNTENGTAVGNSKGSTYSLVDFRILDGTYTLTKSVQINGNSTVRLLNALNDWVASRPDSEHLRYWKHDNSTLSAARIRGTHPTHIYLGDGNSLKRQDETEDEKAPKGNPYNIVYKKTATMTELYESQLDAAPGGNYSISSGDEMTLLSMFVEEGHATKDANFYLTKDIFLTAQGSLHGGAGFVPIGTGISIDFEITSPYKFRGNFDGCGFIVYGLYVVSDFLDFTGLFGRCNGSTIKNLGVCGDILGDDEVGGIVGRLEDGKIINCWSSVNIQASTELGGIAGHIVDSTIENCASYGLLITTLDEHEDSGGIVGSTLGDCQLNNCYYLYRGADAAYNKISSKTVIKDSMYFNYDILGDQSCTLKSAITIGNTTSDDLLTVLNAWVYEQNSEQYCTWHTATSLQDIPGAQGYFPILRNPEVDPTAPADAYCGDYENCETDTMTNLYNSGQNGIEGGYYSISNIEDLQSFRKYVNEGHKTRNITFFLKCDINMSYAYSAETGQSWIPVGTADSSFNGVFDGQGYTLKYIYIANNSDDQGFFGHVTGVNAVVKNLGISGSISTTGINAAAIVADFNFGTIANCWTSCAVEAGGNAGGIAGGCNTGTILNCTSYGLVVSTGAYGAISGYPAGTTIKYCYYMYATCQQAYPKVSAPNAVGVTFFNGTGAACILHEKVTVNGTKTQNALSALKVFVDTTPDVNYCYWDVGDSLEYYEMGVTGFPVLISASNTKGEQDYKTVQAVYNDEEFYSIPKAIAKANETEGGGTVKVVVNAVLNREESITLDDDVYLDTDAYSVIVKSTVQARSMQQLLGTYVVKEGGGIKTCDSRTKEYRLFIYSRRTADPSCNSAFYSTDSVTVMSAPLENASAYDYNLTIKIGTLTVNSASDSGNPHRVPAGSILTIAEGGTLDVATNARIRTYGGSKIMNYGTVKIGNVTLYRNTGVLMKGVFEDNEGSVTLPYIYKDGYTLKGWSDGESTFAAGTTVEFNKEKELTAQWKVGASADPYPGDDFYDDRYERVYDIPMTIIQSNGGILSPESLYVAKGDNLTVSYEVASGYYLKNFLVDGKKAEFNDEEEYQFSSIYSPHNVVALYAKTANLEYYKWKEDYKYKDKFKDVSSDEWYYESVRSVASAGYFVGTSEDTFSPDNAMTREMLVTVLWRISGSPLIPGYGLPFKDVPEDSYAYEAIRWANYFGIVKGISDTEFGYTQPITREQFVTIMFRYSKDYAGDNVSEYDETNIFGYSDVMDISYGMTQSFRWAIGAGIIKGTDDKALDPRGATTRAQAAAIIQRYLDKFMYEYTVMG